MPKLNTLAVTLLGVVSYLGTTVAMLQSSAFVTAKAHEESEASVIGENYDASWNYNNPEIDLLIVDLARERKAIEQRKQELEDFAARLQNERHEINQVTQFVHQLQTQFDETVLYVKKNETANLKKLAKIYISMTPQGALSILKQFEDDQFVKILSFMKETEMAPILEALAKEGPESIHRAATLAERLRLTMQEATTASGR